MRGLHGPQICGGNFMNKRFLIVCVASLQVLVAHAGNSSGGGGSNLEAGGYLGEFYHQELAKISDDEIRIRPIAEYQSEIEVRAHEGFEKMRAAVKAGFTFQDRAGTVVPLDLTTIDEAEENLRKCLKTPNAFSLDPNLKIADSDVPRLALNDPKTQTLVLNPLEWDRIILRYGGELGRLLQSAFSSHESWGLKELEETGVYTYSHHLFPLDGLLSRARARDQDGGKINREANNMAVRMVGSLGVSFFSQMDEVDAVHYFQHSNLGKKYVKGYFEDGKWIPGNEKLQAILAKWEAVDPKSPSARNERDDILEQNRTYLIETQSQASDHETARRYLVKDERWLAQELQSMQDFERETFKLAFQY
jgi:hypothetical protein